MKKKVILVLLVVIIFIGTGIFISWNNNKNVSKESKNLPKKTEEIITLEDKDVKDSIFNKYYKEAIKTVENMTIEEKVGQLFLVRYDVNDVKYLSNYYPGGYILFAKDFDNHDKDSMRKEIADTQKLNKYPLIMGVDEEGGFVTRVSRYPAFRNEKFASPRYYYDQGGYDLLEKTEVEKAKMLKDIGINLNLAPVVDISTNENDFIYNRAFGKDAKETSEFAKRMVTISNNEKINSCLKHFPGYGNNVDTHTGIAIDERSYESFKMNDFLPFEAGIKAGVPSILVSHNVIKSIDEKYPASLSENVIKELRDTLNFTGIIITDDLAMDAVKNYVENNEAATLAINAGNDMLITSDFVNMYNEVLNSVKEKKIKEETINKAVIRIIAWKYYSDLWN